MKLKIYRRQHDAYPWVLADDKGVLLYRAEFHDILVEQEKRSKGYELVSIDTVFKLKEAR